MIWFAGKPALINSWITADTTAGYAYGVALLFTLSGIIGVAVLVPLITALPKLLDLLELGAVAALLRWPILAFLAFAAVWLLYRHAPSHRPRAAWRAVTPGAILFTVLWLVVCFVYSMYVGHFADFASTYGALEGVSEGCELGGACDELRAGVEARHRRDHTVGRARRRTDSASGNTQDDRRRLTHRV